jgi:hypothetical protein
MPKQLSVALKPTKRRCKETNVWPSAPCWIPKVKKYLAKYDIQFLYKKVGYFLERYQKQMS